ncbi:MAG: transporter substrate-binding domain-containing protein [Atopobiaceae bacterium]|nr:transporter substrate-binding domain-containing protein [Atopobiaceae bacterium]
MKKLLAPLVALVVAVFVLAGCGGSSAESTADATGAGKAAYTEADLGEGFVFKHGFDLDYRPYSYIDDEGNNAGFDVEMAQALCELYGWEYKAVPFNWDSKDAELNSGGCDCIWAGFTMNGREDDYQWSEPYSDNTQMIMVKKGSDIKTIEDLAGKKVGVQTGTSALEMLQDEDRQKALADTFGDLVVTENYTVAITELEAGSVDALAIDATRAAEAMAKNEKLVCLDEELGSEQYGVGFRKGDTVLCEKINEGLKTLSENGTVDKIAKKYPEIAEYLTLGKK